MSWYKRIFFSSVVLIVVSSCGGEEQCDQVDDSASTITLQINGNTDGTYIATVINYDEAIPLDTFDLDEHGVAQFSTKISGTNIIRIMDITKRGEIIVPVTLGEKVKVVADSENLEESYTVSGSEEMQHFNRYLELFRNYNHFRDSLSKVHRNLKRNNAHYAVEDEFNKLFEARKVGFENALKAFIDEDPGKFTNYFAIQHLPIKRFQPYHEKLSVALSRNFPNSPQVRMYVLNVNRFVAKSVGGLAPNFVLPTNDSQTIQLSDYKGKYVLLDFWATWCGPCKEEIPNLKATYERFKGEEFELISVCVDKESNKPSWNRIIENYDANWIQAFDATAEVASVYNIRYFPSVFLLNKEGEVIAKDLRGPKIPAAVEAALKQD